MIKTFVKVMARSLGIILVSWTSVAAAPGVALTLDVTQAMDDRGNACMIQAHTTAHVTLLHLDGDKQIIQHEVTRFLTDINKYFQSMIQESFVHANIHNANNIEFKNAVFVPDLFKSGANPGLKAYVPGPVAAMVFVHLNKLINEFINGTYSPNNVHSAGTSKIGGYQLQVTQTTAVGNYTPHMSVKNPTYYPGSAIMATPVASLTASLTQALNPRWHR